MPTVGRVHHAGEHINIAAASDGKGHWAVWFLPPEGVEEVIALGEGDSLGNAIRAFAQQVDEALLAHEAH